MFSRIIAWLDYFIGPAFSQDRDSLYKCRMLVGSVFSFILSVFAFAPYYLLISNLPDLAIAAYFLSTGPLVAIWAVVLYLLRQGKAFQLSSNIVVASIEIILYAGIAITGGPEKTEVHTMLIVPIIVAFLFIGHRGGIIWALTTILIYYTMYLLSVFELVSYINFAPEEMQGLLRAFNWTYSIIIATALVFVYEYLTQSVTEERDTEREKLINVVSIAAKSNVVNEGASVLENTGTDLLSSTTQQTIAIEKLSSTTEELNATAEQNSILASDAIFAIKNTEQHILTSKTDLLELSESMAEVKQSSEKIDSINNIINDIAYQTNLLSLNAMIEASRSDEGGGFQVVALEIKKLAERSAKSADDINKLLNHNLIAVKKGDDLSQKIQQHFQEISDCIKPLSTSIHNVSNASKEQHEAIQQITSGLADIDKAIADNKASALTSSETASKLKQNANSLLNAIEALDAS